VEVAPPFPAASVARLELVPWRALSGVAAALDAPLSAVLEGAAAERVLDRLLRARRDLGPEGRRAVAEAVFGVGLWRRRLAHHAGAGAPPRALLAALLRDLAGLGDAEGICGLAPGALPPRAPAPRDLARFYSLPDWLAVAVAREAGAEAPLLADALNVPGPVWLRANRSRVDRRALSERLAREGVRTRPGALAPDALEVTSPRPNLLALPSFRDGLFEVQDEGSQLLGLAVGARPGDEVLDLCAGAGGKALLLGAALAGSGAVHACDPDAARLERLLSRAGRAGVRDLVRVHRSGPPPGLEVDRALVDAPCSSLGALRRGPDERFRIDPASFDGYPPLQLELLGQAASRLRPGGRLVYATCTFRSEENEGVAVAFERSHPEYARVAPVDRGELLTSRGFLALWPHRHRTDGFFAAAWERRS